MKLRSWILCGVAAIPFGIALRRTMERIGISQYELAKKAGLQQSTISQLLSKPERSPISTTVEKIEKALGCKIYLEEEPDVQKDLEEFKLTEDGKALAITAEEERQILLRPWYPIGKKPLTSAWVQYVLATRGLRDVPREACA